MGAFHAAPRALREDREDEKEGCRKELRCSGVPSLLSILTPSLPSHLNVSLTWDEENLARTEAEKDSQMCVLCGGPVQTHYTAFADPPPSFPSVSRVLKEDHRAQDALRPVRCSHRHGPEWCVSSFRSALKSGALTFER